MLDWRKKAGISEYGILFAKKDNKNVSVLYFNETTVNADQHPSLPSETISGANQLID